MTVNVLVTGVGQTIGLGILKALACSGLDYRVWVTDCNPLAVGLHMMDQGSLLPSVTTSPHQYLQALAQLCRQAKIAIILPGSEPELQVLCKVASDFQRETDTFIMTGCAKAVLGAMDKWQTFQFLTSQGFPVPHTILPTPANLEPFAQEQGFPLIVKPRRGSASRGVYLVENPEQLRFYALSQPGVIVQEYIGPMAEEYTAGVFLPSPGHSHGCIVLQRELVAGVTFRAEVAEAEDVRAYTCKIGEKTGLTGPCNVQFRRAARGPVVLEINPRFSSSVSIRAHFGFNEPAMAIQHFILQEELAPPRISRGIALRYWEEKYVPQE